MPSVITETHKKHAANVFPTEEMLTRSFWMDDEYFNKNKLRINTDALVYAASHAISKQSTPILTFMGSGGWNKLFCLTFPDGAKVVARIPNIGSRFADKIHSTVAMMMMARYHLQIPVPDIFAWHPSNDNPVGAPYILLEWVDGIEPWQRWYTLSPEDRSSLLDELAQHHAEFARPLAFKGIGSIFFAPGLPESADPSDLSTYRLGQISHGPSCTAYREISSWPQTQSLSLRQFWQRLWQHECDFITRTYGIDRDTVIADEDHPKLHCPRTLGKFLDAAGYLKTLITNCPLPSQAEFYEPCFVTTDYAFRNIKLDTETLKVTSFLDWDDVYVLPFLLCSRFPEDICFFDGSGERWHKTGAFTFLPLDEESTDECSSQEPREIPSEGPPPEETNSETPSQELTDEPPYEEPTSAPTSDEQTDEPLIEEPDIEPPEEPTEPDDRGRRILDTQLRKEYAQLLAKYDSRYGVDGFWTMREEPLKIQHLVMHGWIAWLNKLDWLKDRAGQIQRQSST
jgi:hypothetical protein